MPESAIPRPTRSEPRGIIVTLSGGILFDTGKTSLKPGAKSTLTKIAKQLQTDPSLKIAVEGHTDTVGTAAKNQALSEKRANAVPFARCGHDAQFDAGAKTVAAVDHAVRCPRRPHVTRAADPDDVAAVDEHGAVAEDPALGIHADHDRVLDEDHVPRCRRSCCSSARTFAVSNSSRLSPE